uniref:Integrase catalytic domain-containing protein n=1 Tax=Chromera velia CCMP2878 TaxID=1169474 RepID=A0A0G4FF14_9ALVE|eukprot:Cvel_16610.t1-p1 / transcript=Cvel_16610.t1 / gene=Cvel_16610 / organism=Chromera_velia_CCMP2878 / gene_product=hypothetical protein / transcript_product=hypothetical protein / location=Cvel_scaffold1287:4195-6004(+) / protein_length=493 / sequence_SO=supercontig / SO=protein_coding / is_pseudo=false
MVKKTTRFDLASALSSLTTDNVCTLHIPVRDVHGRLRIAVEKGTLTTEMDEALHASAKRRLSLSENGGWMKMTGLHGETFKVPIDQLGDLPTVDFPTNEIAAASAAAVIPSCVQTAFIGRRGGGEKKSVGLREEADQEKRRKFFYLLHLRFAHSTGLRLLNTLKEKGVGGGYTLKECSDMCEDCFTCKAFNMRNRRIGRREGAFAGGMNMTGLHGETFKVPVDQSGDLSTVDFPTNEIAAASAAAVIPPCMQTAFTGRRGGGEKKSVGSREEADQEKRRKFFYLLHLRFAHSTGLHLLSTLKEKGVGGGYTLKECSDVCGDCFACKAFNMRNRRIGRRWVRANRRERQKQKWKPKEPSESDSQVEEETIEGSAEKAPSLGDLSTHFNHQVVHDLTFPKQRGMGGDAGMSVIIDKSSRRVSLRSFKRKYESSRHLLSYHRRWEKKKRGVKEVFIDNGGEFVGEEYQETVERIGAALTLGPPYTPEAQAEVERMN